LIDRRIQGSGFWIFEQVAGTTIAARRRISESGSLAALSQLSKFCRAMQRVVEYGTAPYNDNQRAGE
jgi:hypothetical protein